MPPCLSSRLDSTAPPLHHRSSRARRAHVRRCAHRTESCDESSFDALWSASEPFFGALKQHKPVAQRPKAKPPKDASDGRLRTAQPTPTRIETPTKTAKKPPKRASPASAVPIDPCPLAPLCPSPPAAYRRTHSGTAPWQSLAAQPSQAFVTRAARGWRCGVRGFVCVRACMSAREYTAPSLCRRAADAHGQVRCVEGRRCRTPPQAQARG